MIADFSLKSKYQLLNRGAKIIAGEFTTKCNLILLLLNMHQLTIACETLQQLNVLFNHPVSLPKQGSDSLKLPSHKRFHCSIFGHAESRK